MGAILNFKDLKNFPEAVGLSEALANDMIEDVEAEALSAASCVFDPEFPYMAAAKSILRSAVLRWANAGSAGVKTKQETAGSFTEMTTWDNTHAATRSAGRLWTSEVRKLQDLCRKWKSEGTRGRKAFTIMPGLRRAP